MLTLSLRADFFANRDRAESRRLQPPVTRSDEAVLENLGELFFLSGDWTRYPWRPPLGLTLRTNHVFQLAQRFSSSTRDYHHPVYSYEDLGSQADREWRYDGSIETGVGFGRVRDVTPVYRAQVLEDRLRRTGALSRALSTAARERVAALFTGSFEFGYAHERPSKYFWEALERVLREDGALEKGALDAYSAHRVLEPLVPGGVVFRRSGFFIGPAVGFSMTQLHSSREYAYSTRSFQGDSLYYSSGDRYVDVSNDRSDEFFTSLVAQYHRPLGLHWQLGASNTTRIADAGEYVSATTGISATWMVSDRWLGAVSALHNLRATEHGTAFAVDTWSVTLFAELHYFLEDSWALSARASEFQDHRRSSYLRSGRIELGITHVFTGYFELPGVVEVMRATPPLR